MSEADTIQPALGVEPPMTIGEEDPSRFTRRGVSLRWLFGGVVTAVTSLALMGGALVAALDGRYVVEAAAGTEPSHTVRGVGTRATKGDRVMPAYEPVSSRKVIEVPTVSRGEAGDTIVMTPYALINAGLVLDRGAIGDIPPFNARTLVTNVQEERPTAASDAIYDRAVDGEITVTVTDLPTAGSLSFAGDVGLDDDEILRQLTGDGTDAESAYSSEPGTLIEALALVPPNVTVVPENVSKLVKVEAEDAADGPNELVELIQPGDTLRKILRGSGVPDRDVSAINDVLTEHGREMVKPGQLVRIAFSVEESDDQAVRRPSRLTLYEGSTHLITVAMADSGAFVSARAPTGPVPKVEDVEVAARKDGLPTVYQSLYQTALDHDLPAPVRDRLLAAFSLDHDFNATVRPGDKLIVLHGLPDDAGSPEILFAALTAAGVDRRLYRFKSSDGTVDFFDEDGRTGDKFLLRKPMARGVFRSGFGMRRHPILRRRRMHNGVDWAAPRGTPIYAAGDGVIKQAGWKAGYGRWVSIRHKNGYETGYAHQSRIAKGIKPGVKVRQGQVIGYVGSTGFSTGPHLHYEVRVNNRHVNPLTIRLRRGRELSGSALEAFQAERERIDALIGREEIAVAAR